jgi:hypothetical protein
MNEANPDGLGTPETTSAGLDTASAPAQGPAAPMPRRSNEFWLALASTAAAVLGVAATATVGIWAAHLAYKSSANQVKAETDRANLAFSREQRKAVYLDFLNKEDTVHNEAFMTYETITDYVSGKIDFQVVHDHVEAWNKADDAAIQATNAAQLFASRSAYNVIEEWAKYDEKVHDAMVGIIEQTNAGKVPSPDRVSALGQVVGTEHEPSPKHFEDVAQPDLGVSR